MRIETVNGKRIVCAHIYPEHEIQPGSLWIGAGCTVVKVENVKDGLVTYSWTNKTGKHMHIKSVFAFQCRYCLIVE